MAYLEWFVPKGRARMHHLQWQVKAHWAASADNPAVPGPSSEECQLCIRWWTGGEVELWSPSASSFSISFVQWYISSWLGSASAGFDCSGIMDISGERTSYQCRSDEANSFSLKCLPAQDHWRGLVLKSNNTTVVAYVKEQRGTVFLDICRLPQKIIAWLDLHMVTILARYIPGKKNFLVDRLSHLDQVLPTDWSLLPRLFDDICREFSSSLVNLFTRVNVKLLIYMSSIPMAWKEDAFSIPGMI